MLIAHSLGVILVAHHAATRPNSPVRAALLVAPGDADLHAPTNPPITSFAPVPRTRLPYPSTMVVSRTSRSAFCRWPCLLRSNGVSRRWHAVSAAGTRDSVVRSCQGG
ncbi:RBBP9/YdeN family alpha/beta hydrolase [Chelatococcus asaccharovorans]|uniref:RBBP9/YdeN family alpha/beta hydrolase n=1 Tax=Chelatococcus asaccharovorans TaxID=28210 RepID=UPI003974DD95